MTDVHTDDIPGVKAPEILSPEKITRKAKNFAEIPPEPSEGQQEVIHNMLQEWVETHGTNSLPTTPPKPCPPNRSLRRFR